jgi:hypothetical protein
MTRGETEFGGQKCLSCTLQAGTPPHFFNVQPVLILKKRATLA